MQQLRHEILMMAAALLLLASATAARAAVPDNLQCYKLTNANLRGLRGVVDLDAPSIDVALGCTLSKAKLYCVPADAKVRRATLFDGGTPLTELPFQGRPAETDRICYRVTCPFPVGTAPDQTVTDRFGAHEFKKLRTEMVCTPAVGGTLPPPQSGFQITFPEVDIYPGQDIPYCYYFRTPNAVALPVKRFVSELGPYSQQLIAFTTTTVEGLPVDRFPPGTVSTVDCSLIPSGLAVPHWVYEAHTPNAELAFPSNDGAGNPVALEIPPLSSGFLLLHTVNTSNQVIKTKAILNAEALDSPVYTKTATFTAFSSQISIPPLANGYVESKSCTLPTGAQFWWLSTHAHKRAVRTNVLEGFNVVLESLDWGNPAALTRVTAPFVSFASNRLTYGCTYNNPFNTTIRTGPSYQTEEQCAAVGYFFPATRPLKCVNGYAAY